MRTAKSFRTQKEMKDGKVVAEVNYSGDNIVKNLRMEKLRKWRVLSKAF